MKNEFEILKVRKIVHGIVELRSDNILTFRPDVATFKEYNLDVLKDLLDVFLEITDGVPRLYLCDNKYITGIVNREEQEYINKHIDKFATKTAMITHSTIVRVLVNQYNLIFKPKVQICLFKSEEQAVTWLLSGKS